MRLKRNIAGIVVAFVVFCFVQSVTVKAADYMPFFIKTTKCTVTLAFNNNTATCIAYISGKNGTTSVSGKLKLYDVTESKSVKKWSISKAGNSYTGSKTATVKSGHTYRLKFTGTVKDGSGNSESVSAKVKKTKRARR